MIKKILWVISLINICFQIVYMIFGKQTNGFIYVFYVFRIEYMLLSGLISFVILIITTILIIINIVKIVTSKIKVIDIGNIIVLILNVEHVIYYVNFLSLQ